METAQSALPDVPGDSRNTLQPHGSARRKLTRCVHTQLVAAALVEFAAGDPSDAVGYAQLKRRKKQTLRECFPQEVLRWHADAFAEGGPLREPTSDVARKVAAAAQRYLQEQRLWTWVRAQNSNRSLAPSASACWKEWSHISDGDAGKGSSARAKRSRYQWLARWRLRWGVRRGRFRLGDRLSVDVMRHKVAT